MASLLRRISSRADTLAAGTGEPAGVETDEPLVKRPNARERGRMRRRLRRLLRVRDAKLRELGGLVLELQRRGRENAELVRERSAELIAIDDEARELARALHDERELSEVLAAGIVGACAECGALMSTQDNFCANCGAAAGVTSGAAPADANNANGSHPGSGEPHTQELHSS
jgi:transposase